METPISPFTPAPEPENKNEFFEQYKYWILGVFVIIAGIGIYLILIPPTDTLAQNGEDIFIADTSATVNDSSRIVVDISGGIASPGVYELVNGSIIEDAIDAAGGFSLNADIDEIARSINRAALVDNHSKIYLPKIGDNQIVYLNSPSYSPTNPVVDPEHSRETNLININTATTAELDKLPGIGPITAQRIIDYRLQNGDFSVIDEIKKVYGISDSKFNNLKNQISV